MLVAEPVIETSSGRVRGRSCRDGRVAVWRGIPFAAPPVGALRFAAPQPVVPWAGERDAGEHGRVAVQPPRLRPGALKVWLGARRSRSEDCLNLSVWAPASAAESAAAGAATAGGAAGSATLRPVVVWIHGGSFLTGTGSLFDPSALVIEGDVVVVTINYRLGVFGFVDVHDALGGDERVATNAGLLDQRAALAWVRDHIAAFGGDPARVTVAGESAGSCGAVLHLASAGSRGLMHGVIAQSAGLTLAATREDAARSGRELLDELGVSRERRDELWRMPASRLLAAGIAVQRRRTGSLATRPWWDDDVLPASLDDAYVSAASAGVPLLIGSNLHEHRTFTKTRADVLPLTRAALATSMTESFGWTDAAEILREYPLTADGLNDLGSDFVFRMPAVHLSEAIAGAGGSAWLYRLDYGHGLLGLGAYHAIELGFLFWEPGRTHRLFVGPPGDTARALAARFRAHWLAFVRTGRPGDGWPAYTVPAGDAARPNPGAGAADPGTSAAGSGGAGTGAAGSGGAGTGAAGERATRIFDASDRVEYDLLPARRRAWAGRDATVH